MRPLIPDPRVKLRALLWAAGVVVFMVLFYLGVEWGETSRPVDVPWFAKLR